MNNDKKEPITYVKVTAFTLDLYRLILWPLLLFGFIRLLDNILLYGSLSILGYIIPGLFLGYFFPPITAIEKYIIKDENDQNKNIT